MPEKIKTLGKYAGYGLLALLLFLYFSLLTFPYDLLKDRLLLQWADKLPCRIHIEEIRTTPFLWIQCTGIEIFQKKKMEGEQPLDLEKLKMRPSLLKLITGKPVLRLKGLIYNGQVKGTAGKNNKDMEIALDWKDIQMSDNPLLAKMEGSQMTGMLSGELLLNLKLDHWITSEGTLTFQFDQGSFSGLQIRGFTLPDMQEVTGKGEIRMAKKKATVETLALTSDLLSSSLDGKIDLRSRFNSSRLNIKGKIKLTGELASQYEPMLASILRNKDEENFYAYTIKGSIKNPRFSF